MHAILFVAAVVFQVQGTETFGESKPKTIKPILIWSGVDSRIKVEKHLLIESDKEWRTLWFDHMGSSNDRHIWLNYPIVDFESYQIIAIFQGPSFARYGIFAKLAEEADYLRLSYSSPGYQASNDDKYNTYCYLFVVIPKSKKVVVIEGSIKRCGSPTEIIEHARLAPKEK